MHFHDSPPPLPAPKVAAISVASCLASFASSSAIAIRFSASLTTCSANCTCTINSVLRVSLTCWCKGGRGEGGGIGGLAMRVLIGCQVCVRRCQVCVRSVLVCHSVILSFPLSLSLSYPTSHSLSSLLYSTHLELFVQCFHVQGTLGQALVFAASIRLVHLLLEFLGGLRKKEVTMGQDIIKIIIIIIIIIIIVIIIIFIIAWHVRGYIKWVVRGYIRVGNEYWVGGG